MGAGALDRQLDVVGAEAAWQPRAGGLQYLVQTKDAPATTAVKVRMFFCMQVCVEPPHTVFVRHFMREAMLDQPVENTVQRYSVRTFTRDLYGLLKLAMTEGAFGVQ